MGTNRTNLGFREWLGQLTPQDAMRAQRELVHDPSLGVGVQTLAPFKLWRASREEIIRHWNGIRPQPVVFRSIPPEKKGSTFSEDGIRFTGTRKFIDSCLARFKDLLSYENQSTKLDVVWRQIGPKNPVDSPGELPTFVFYMYVRDRKPGQPVTSPLGGVEGGETGDDDE